MKTRKSFLPGAMSFCLPGLGALYLGQLPRAAVHFCLFVVFLALPALKGLLPLVVILAAADGYWITPEEMPPSAKGRTFAFLSVAIAGLLSWFSVAGAVRSPYARQMQINRDVVSIAARIRSCGKRLGAYPKSLLSCGFTELEKDPWDSDYDYVSDGSGFELRSRGADRTPGTEDDYKYPFR